MPESTDTKKEIIRVAIFNSQGKIIDFGTIDKSSYLSINDTYMYTDCLGKVWRCHRSLIWKREHAEEVADLIEVQIREQNALKESHRVELQKAWESWGIQ
jgi:hypothetical protein